MGFAAFALAALLGIISLVLGLIGLLRTRKNSGRSGRERAWVGVGAGGVLIFVLLIGVSTGSNAPAIHDVTTNIDDPPTFSDAVRNAPGRANGVDYPDGGPSVPDQQRNGFPELAPLQLSDTPANVLERSREAAESLGWTVTLLDAEAMLLEAYDTTSVFRFVDDVVVRVRPSSSGSVVDLRSNSRVGGGDLGANAARIFAFLELLQNP
jgi:uncharacterized protein (DUF1499 family)